MYVHGIRRLFRFPGYVVDKISVGGRPSPAWNR